MNVEITANKFLDNEVEVKMNIGKGESDFPIEIVMRGTKQLDSTISLSIAKPKDRDYILYDNGLIAGIIDVLCCISGRKITKKLYDITERVFSSEESHIDEIVNLDYYL